MLRVWAYLSSRPRTRQCAVIVGSILFGWFCAWIAGKGTGIPMEWPQ
jgi:hypothetical protein